MQGITATPVHTAPGTRDLDSSLRLSLCRFVAVGHAAVRRLVGSPPATDLSRRESRPPTAASLLRHTQGVV
eukprot:scaffold86082_cov28-Tisochrysis_lutea.AAC.5